ncbi:HU family DNA-binding protein [uncultured Desulfosarcina sp.]|nr:HU family DNA-binding protein [uncultured Desulfosarcina sp.]
MHVKIPPKKIPFFKPGKELKERVTTKKGNNDGPKYECPA